MSSLLVGGAHLGVRVEPFPGFHDPFAPRNQRDDTQADQTGLDHLFDLDDDNYGNPTTNNNNNNTNNTNTNNTNNNDTNTNDSDSDTNCRGS